MATAADLTAGPQRAATVRGRRPGARLLVALAVAAVTTLVAWRTGDWWQITGADTGPRGDDFRVDGPGTVGNLTAARVLLFAAVFGLVYALPGLVRRTTRLGWAVFGGWALLLTLWLVATWPGLIVSDTVDLVVFSRQAVVYDWFSYLYSLSNVALLDLVPHAAVWAPIQIALMAGTMAYASQLIHAIGRSPWPVVLMNVVAALSAPVIVNSLVYGRDTIFALLHIVLALVVASAVVKRRWPSTSAIAGIAALTAVLSVLRGDGIVLLVIVPLLLSTIRPPRREALKAAGLLVAALILVRVIVPAPLTIDGRAEIYSFALRINPLSAVLQSPFHSPDRARDLRDLSRVIDVQKARELHRPAEMELFYSPFWRRDASDADFAAFRRAADRIFLNNPTTTLAARLETFGTATGLAPGTFTFSDTATTPLRDRMTKLRELSRYLGGDFTGLAAAQPPVVSAYTAQADLLRPTTQYKGLSPGGTALHWNFLPWLGLLAAALLFWRRVPFEAAFATVILSRVPLVFLAAPSAQFKYYYSVHLGGIILLGFLAARLRREHVDALTPRWLRDGDPDSTKIKVTRFALVSGTGLCIDYAIYTVLCEAGVPPGVSNFISAGIAVTFVYLVSGRTIFRASGRDLHRLFVAYVAFQAVAVPLASVAVHAATDLLDDRYLLGKTVVLPFTFAANYLFTSRLLGGRRVEAPNPS